MVDVSNSITEQTCKGCDSVSRYKKLASSPLSRCIRRWYVSHQPSGDNGGCEMADCGGKTNPGTHKPDCSGRATRIDRTTSLGTKMSTEQHVYGANPSAPATVTPPARTKIRTHHLQKWKAEGHKWGMLTAYDYSTARVFDEAGIPVLLVGDSAANVVYGYDTTVPISIDELIPLVRGVVRGAPHALVVADMPFGSYEPGPQHALASATRFMKEAGAHAVKLEGGERVADQIAMLSAAGIPVMAHIGFTPQSVNTLGGFRVQGRGDAAEQTIADAIAVQEAGAFSVVMEMVPAELAT